MIRKNPKVTSGGFGDESALVDHAMPPAGLRFSAARHRGTGDVGDPHLAGHGDVFRQAICRQIKKPGKERIK
jgi:hypothetical protein